MVGDESLGEYLKKERESRNISLDDVSRNTRIQEYLLKAIEEGRYDVLPSTTYVKGFITAYAKYLGLSPDEVILRYEKEQKGRPKTIIEILPPKRDLKGIKKILIIGIVILVSIFISYLIYPLKSTRVYEENKVAKTPSPENVKSIYPSEEKFISLKLKTTEKTWIRIKVNGEVERDAMLMPGDAISYNAKDRIRLLIGNAGGINIIFNERPLEKFGKSGEVVTLLFTPERVERILPEKRIDISK